MMLSSATDINFSFAPHASTPSPWGTGRLTTYDVAIHIDDPFFAGSTIKGVRVQFPDTGGELAPECKGWATTALRLDEEGANRPDIISVEGILQDQGLSIDFPSPIIIPEGGLYVGYTVTVTALDKWTQKFPNPVVSLRRGGGMYVHDPGKYTEWTEMSSSVSAMEIVMNIQEYKNAVSPRFRAESYTRKGERVVSEIELTTHTKNPVNSIGYVVKVGEKEEKGALTLTTPLTDIGGQITQEVELPAPESEGDYTCSLEITEVNGESNEDPYSNSTTSIHVLDFMPENHPLMEEYTGFWCTGCPSAYVTLLEMHDAYPDLVAISIHNKDKITTVDPSKYPFYISGYPTVTLNRNRNTEGSMETFYARESRKLAPVAIEVATEWKDEEQEILTAKVSSRFIKSYEGRDIRIGLCLTGSGMSDPSWVQRNNYYGRTDLEGPYWKPFVEGNGGVTGLIYDDIALIYPTMAGIAGSLPQTIERGEIYTYSYEFNIEDAVNCHTLIPEYGQNLVQDKEKLRVVAFVYDYDNKEVMNSSISSYTGESSGVEGVEIETEEVLYKEYYTLSGIRVTGEPQQGIYVIVSHLRDGSVQSQKVIRDK